MRIISMNIRGLGGSNKKRGLRELVRKEKADLVFIQETKLEVFDDKLAKSIWGDEHCAWVAKDARGRSGGIACVWNLDSFNMVRRIEGSGFIGMFGFWGKDEVPCFLINVYSSCDKQEKRTLWGELLDLIKANGGGNWCVGGDFNAVRDQEERSGRYFDATDMRGFNDFILGVGLEEIPMVGRKFTWYKPDGTAMSKLDRFLFSTEFLINFPNLSLRALNRDLSDHCPILLKSLNTDWGPKPFRSLDCWMNHEGFEVFVHDKWRSFEIEGWGCYKLKEKLKMLKMELKAWNKEVFGGVDRNIDAAREEIKQLDEKEENGGLTSMEIDKRKENFHKLMEWSKAKDSMLFQKSRQRWLKEGDANTKYFHGCIVHRRKQNGITGLYSNGEWIEDAGEVKELARNYFKRKFEEEKWSRPTLGDLQFKKISEADNKFLISKFSTEEIDEAVWGCNGTKSPGPDGFNFNFIKKVWPVIKEDVYAFLVEFHENGKLVKGSNASFLVLIPKKDNPQSLGDYRPISLISSMYKIVSKILANRLRKVLDLVISPNQTAFIGGRQITDGIIITNEIIHEAKQSKKPMLVFKADFEKAYDSVNWELLAEMMNKLGFSTKWRAWIKECLSSATVSVMINGSPTKEFTISKGLRQGDPLAPFLFLMVAEALNGLISKATEEGLFKGVTVGELELNITHLQFADDSIFFCEASAKNVWMIKCILRSFELLSGLKVNFHKSALYGFNVDNGELLAFADSLNCLAGMAPFKYLGVLVGANPRKLSTWKPVIDCLRKKLSSWRCNSLSFGGRITLLNSVLACIPVYYFSSMKAPKQVLNLISLIQRRFLWGGNEEKNKISWVKWERVCRSRREGGLGVKDVGTFNLALLGKWRWRLLQEKGNLCRKVLEAKYKLTLKNEWEGGEWGGRCSPWWRDLWSLDRIFEPRRNWVKEGMLKSVGEGSDTLFWHNIWVGEIPFKEKYNRLFRISLDQEAVIADMGSWNQRKWEWEWRWRRNLFVWENELLQELINELQGISLKKGQQDTWMWKHSREGKYSVQTAYKYLSQQHTAGSGQKYDLVWNKNVPLKVTAFAWKLLQNRIPTKDNLMKRGMNGQGNDKCVLCDLEAESVEHLFFKCNVSWSIWASCYDWWDLKVAAHSKGWPHLEQHIGMISTSLIKEMWIVVWFATVWSIWIWRNQKIFKDGADTREQVVELIKFRSFYWCKTALCSDLVQDKWRSKPTEGYMRVQQRV
ncbi:hypothetical protein SLA2020_255190 [Shorea laevis]